MGGAIALTLALNHPDRVAGLGLISTGARLKVTPAILNQAESQPEVVAELLMRWLWGDKVDSAVRERGKTQFMTLKPSVIARDYAASNVFDVRDRLGEIGVPTLVLCGTEDVMTAPKYSESLTAGIVGARVQWFEGAGHMLQIERSAEVAAALTAFFLG